ASRLRGRLRRGDGRGGARAGPPSLRRLRRARPRRGRRRAHPRRGAAGARLMAYRVLLTDALGPEGLARLREQPELEIGVRAGRWEREKWLGTEVCNKVLGIIGLGNIGTIVAERALGLRMKVIAYDPFVTHEVAARLGVELVSLDELYARADFITIHTPL